MELPFNEAAVTVTRTSLSAAGQVIAMRDIEDTRIVTVERSRVVPIVISLIGVAIAAGGGVWGSGAALGCGVMLIVVGWLAWIWQEVSHRLIVVVGGAPREAVTSGDRAFLERVQQAVRAAKADAPAAPAAPAAPGTTPSA
ncbi:DUF6232 family protein [Paraburkholderia sp. Ac-20347]|jgi:hypothetical protein|uniref:DUF6232 family protein n=1 Tax=Paraburkholderia sp. Ac-20347 TaxID=2703892 RepID=UPI001980CA11|nr:DUF6232 family protein [Paraburkholderia sp. Ac-20347]MBN3814270.1 hypothetical protein [Paraburkholderia sp. Ac-20347]